MEKNNSKRYVAAMLAVALAAGFLLGNLQKKFRIQSVIKNGIDDPRIVKDDSMRAGQKVTWDCIWFGSYPQTEIVDKAETCGIYNDECWGSNADYEVDASVYRSLQKATGWDRNGDLTINGIKYRRIKESDATSKKIDYDWSDPDTYHYFRYEPIKWRVLAIDGSAALLLADKDLDNQRYHTAREPVTWETSTIRSWLNGYGPESNKQGADYSNKNFMDAAFTPSQQDGILTSRLHNADNIDEGTEGGNDTSDKVFFLSVSEVLLDTANSYGFVSSEYDDEARVCKSSTYARAMGTWVFDEDDDEEDEYDELEEPLYGYSGWQLRSPGVKTDWVTCVDTYGCVNDISDACYGDGVRPALRLNLSCSDLYSYAGTVCSDGIHRKD